MRLRAFYLLNFLLILVLLGCSETNTTVSGDYVEEDGKILYRGTKNNDLVVQIGSEPPSLHPTNARTASRTFILELIFQRLMTIDISNGELKPELAAGYPERSADGLTYTYELDPSAAWPDGKPMTYEDVLFSIKAMACPLTDNLNQKPYTEFLKDMQPDPDNPRKFIVEMTEYYMHNDNFGIYTFILDPRFYDPDNLLGKYTLREMLEESEKVAADPDVKAWADRFNSAEMGTRVESFQSGSGPYTMEDWITEEQIILKRNENYWGKNKEGSGHAQYPDRIIYKFIRDDNVLELQVKQQEIDVSTQLTTQAYFNLLESEEARQNYHFGIEPRDTYVFLLWNNRPDGINTKKLFDDKRTRQALAYAVPIADIINEIYPETALQTNSPVPQTNPDYNENLEFIPYDPDKARGLLAEAGWEDSDGDQILDKVIDGEKVDFSFTLMYPPSDESLADMVNRMAKAMEDVGIKANIDGKGMGAIVPGLRAHTFDAVLMALSSPSLAYDFKQLFHSTNWPEGDNFFGYNNPEVDELIDQSRVEADPQKREVMVNRIQEIIYEDQPCLFLFNPTKKIVIHKRFNNAEMYPIRDYVILNNLQMIWEGE